MDQLNWKLEKVNSLDDEVKQLHPLLKELFRSMPQVKDVYYTQGNRENGADFILVKEDEILSQDDYVGVIVKSTPIRQNHEDVIRQIRECTSIPRPIEGGKKSIYLSEVWIVTNKDITRNAQDFLHAEYKTTKIKFIDCNKLVSLIDRHFSSYWDYIDASLGKHVDKERAKITSLEAVQRLVPGEIGHIIIDQQIQRAPEESKRKFQHGTSKPTKLFEEIPKRKAIFLEGGMGSGKSELLRSTALMLCDKDIVNRLKIISYFTTYRDLQEDPDYKAGNFIEKIRKSIGDESKSVAIFVDGFDEVQSKIEEKVADICRFANSLNSLENTRLIIASRYISEATLGESISKSFDKYAICPLTYGMMVNFVQRICEKSNISNKLKEDLQRSPLMKALPRTPLSAILLGKLLKENINELPSTLPELYSKYVELVLGRWDINKGNGSEKEYETIQRLTAKIATYMLGNDIDALGVAEVKSMFSDYLNERMTGQHLAPMLSSFLSKSELISFDTEQNIIRFKHRTFAEFFYAHALLMEKGKDAPIDHPFDPSWHGIEYFYLGLVRDAPDRLDRLSSYIPNGTAEEFIKLSQFGGFLMAAYQTPYTKIEQALYRSLRDSAIRYQSVTDGEHHEWLSKFPELQILALFTYFVRQSYSYDFFKPALNNAKVEAELDTDLSEPQRIVLIFLVDTVLSSLNDSTAFESLVDRHEAHLGWAVRLGIQYSSNEISFINSATQYVEKKARKSMKGNSGIMSYLKALESTPMEARKDVAKKKIS
ncbi:NACHT domain-containing protein [Burkholderia gladioli]|uniref:NACHT domain-containing protein n=1 Tax=Burkholderia gladioli TaxID=28095 RepID=UPI000F532724|nr:restriction endonuclease [Burkholderia gladioli]